MARLPEWAVCLAHQFRSGCSDVPCQSVQFSHRHSPQASSQARAGSLVVDIAFEPSKQDCVDVHIFRTPGSNNVDGRPNRAGREWFHCSHRSYLKEDGNESHSRQSNTRTSTIDFLCSLKEHYSETGHCCHQTLCGTLESPVPIEEVAV